MKTLPRCGAEHHDYPETVCLEPAGHYQPDRDSHAGPLIIGGRECGGAAWDEPKETRVPDRHTVDTITSDALDALQLRAARMEHAVKHAAELAVRLEDAEDRLAHLQATSKAAGIVLDRAEATVQRVTALYEQWVKAGPPPLGTSISRWWDARLAELHTALSDEPAPAGPLVDRPFRSLREQP